MENTKQKPIDRAIKNREQLENSKKQQTEQLQEKTEPVVELVNKDALKHSEQDEKAPTSLELRSKLSDIAASFFFHIDSYVKNCGRNQLVHQDDLIAAIRYVQQSIDNIINLTEDEDFPIAMQALLAIFNEEKDNAMKPEMLLRLCDIWHDGTKQCLSYQRLIYLLSLLADPATRQVRIRGTQWDYSLEFLAEDKKARLLAFFNV